MLILSRREGDSILIDGDVRIVVLSSDKHGVRLGIEAPADVRILRGEIVDRVRLENERATAPDVSWGALLPPGVPAAAAARANQAGDAPAQSL